MFRPFLTCLAPLHAYFVCLQKAAGIQLTSLLYHAELAGSSMLHSRRRTRDHLHDHEPNVRPSRRTRRAEHEEAHQVQVMCDLDSLAYSHAKSDEQPRETGSGKVPPTAFGIARKMDAEGSPSLRPRMCGSYQGSPEPSHEEFPSTTQGASGGSPDPPAGLSREHSEEHEREVRTPPTAQQGKGRKGQRTGLGGGGGDQSDRGIGATSSVTAAQALASKPSETSDPFAATSYLATSARVPAYVVRRSHSSFFN